MTRREEKNSGGLRQRADFDTFSQGGWKVSQGGWKFFAANANQLAPLRGTSLASSDRRLSDILEFHFLICLGTYFIITLVWTSRFSD